MIAEPLTIDAPADVHAPSGVPHRLSRWVEECWTPEMFCEGKQNDGHGHYCAQGIIKQRVFGDTTTVVTEGRLEQIVDVFPVLRVETTTTTFAQYLAAEGLSGSRVVPTPPKCVWDRLPFLNDCHGRSAVLDYIRSVENQHNL